MVKKYGITIEEGIRAKALANPGTQGNYVRLIPFIQASGISLDDDMSVLNSKIIMQHEADAVSQFAKG